MLIIQIIVFYIIGVFISLFITRYENKYRYITNNSNSEFTTTASESPVITLSWIVVILFVYMYLKVLVTKYYKIPEKFKNWYEGH